MLAPPIRILLLLALPAWLGAQTCGRTDTFALGQFGTTTQTIDITGYLADDLGAAGQGLCGVELYFEHSYVYDFTADLTSPGGQTVSLIGPENNQLRPPTNLARWFVDFVPCATAAAPDPGAPERFTNNNAPFNWRAFGLYRGSYYPAAGCLEDFNVGPVNGRWTITVNNFRAGESARGTFLLLTFCDDRNAAGPCCLADAGEPAAVPPEAACTTDPDLVFDFPPRYRRPRPDSAAYGYTYALVRDRRIVATNDAPDLAGQPPGRYQICGLSYRRGELDRLPTDGSLTLAALRSNLAAVEPLLCGDLTEICRTVDLFAEPAETRLEETICVGGGIPVGDSLYTATGSYRNVLTGRGGCDSTVVLELQVVDELRRTTPVTICAEDEYVQAGNVYTRSGTYVDTLTALGGCDSISTIELTVLPAIATDTLAAVCQGDTFRIGTEAFADLGTYVRTLTAANGCDSTVRLDLLVLDATVRISASSTVLGCDPPAVILTARFDDSVAGGSFRWRDVAGNLLSADPAFSVTAGGRYVAERTLTARGVTCMGTDTVTIEDRRQTVTVDLARTQVPGNVANGRELTLDCRQPELTLLARPAPGAAADYRYAWSAGASTDSTLTVTAAATYYVTVTDPVTGCFGVDSVTVTSERAPPSVTVAGVGTLNCENDTLLLRADRNQPRFSGLEFIWTGDCLADTVRGPDLTVVCAGDLRLTVNDPVTGCSRDTTFTVVQDLSRPTGTAPAAAPLSCYEPLRTLDATSYTSPNGLEYRWLRDGQTVGERARLDVAVAGTYELTLTDSLSRCREVVAVTVAADTLRPVADAGADTLSIDCYTPSHRLGGPATSQGDRYRYAWVQAAAPTDTLARTDRLTVAAPGGTFDLTVLDAVNGCRDTDRVRVLLALDTPFVRLDPPLDFDCFVDSVELSAARTNLNFPHERRWTGPCPPLLRGAETIRVGCPGTYVYTVTNLASGCTASDSVTVALADNSVVASLPDTVYLDCADGTAELDRRNGTDAPQVEWFRDGQPIDLVGLRPRVTVPGRYRLVLGNFDGSCRDTASTVVVADCPVLAIVVPPDSLTCAATSVELDARPSVPAAGPNVTETWLLPDGAVTEAGAGERQLRVLTPGRYGFALRNEVTGTADTAYVTVVINQLQPLAEAGPRDTLTCRQPAVQLDGVGSSQGDRFDYLWTNVADDTLGRTRQISVTSPGVYLLRVTDRFTGCTDVDNVSVFEDTRVPALTFSSASLPCDTVNFPVAVFVDEPGPYTYAWTGPAIGGGGDTDTVRVDAAGRYRAAVTRLRNGCTVAATVEVERLPCPPFPRLADTSLTCQPGPLVLVTEFRDPCAGCTYRWSRDGQAIAGATDSTLTVSEIGNYRIEVTNQFGLTASARARVTDIRGIPPALAGADRRLTCDSSSVLLGSPPIRDNFSYAYRWRDAAGSDLGPGSTLRVTTPGTYALETTNLFSDCRATDAVTVTFDTLRPRADAGTERTLNCDNPLQILDGLGSTTGPGSRYEYRWTTPTGSACIEGGNSLNPIVACGGFYDLTVRDRQNGCTAVDQVRVTADDALPRIVPLPDSVLDCRRDSLRLAAGVEGRPGEVYRWELLATRPPRTVDTAATTVLRQPGRYRFTVADTISGCENGFTFNLTEDRLRPTVIAGTVDTFFCELDSVVVRGSARTDRGVVPRIEWSSRRGFFVGNPNAPTATVFQPDTYYLTATDPRNGCTARDSAQLLRDVEAPLSLPGPDTALTCTRRELRLAGAASTLSGQATYRWSTRNGRIVSGATTATPLIAAPGMYLLEVTDPVNDCTSGNIVTVVEDTLSPRATIALSGSSRLSCNQPAITLNGGGGTTPVRYRWSRADGAPPPGSIIGSELTVRRAGVYELMVTGIRNGCRDSTEVAITENLVVPDVGVVPPTSLSCNRERVSLIADTLRFRPELRYAWLDRQRVRIGTGSTVTVGNPGRYALVTLDTRNGCRDTVAVDVAADTDRPAVVLDTPPELNCARAVSTIDGSGSSRGGNFVAQWESPGSSAIASADPYQIRGRRPGTYYLTVINTDNGCSSRDSTELVRSAVAISDLAVAVEQPGCLADAFGAVRVTGIGGGSGPFTFSLDGGIFTDRREFTDLPVGGYRLEVMGSDGCSRSTTFQLTPGDPVRLELRPDTLIRIGDSVRLDFVTNLTPPLRLTWSSSGPLPDSVPETGPLTVRPFASQAYRLTVDDGSGCRNSAGVLIEVNEAADYYVPTAFSPNGDGSNERFRPYPGPQVATIEAFRVYDRWGELVYDLASDPQRDSENFGWDGTHNGVRLNPQVFVWQLQVRVVDGRLEWETGEVLLMR